MKIAITDANIFIDLFFLEVDHFLFEIGCEIFTTNHVLFELEDYHAEHLEVYVDSEKLKIESVTIRDKSKMSALRLNRGLSESDISVICIAERLDSIVLSGDDLVRKICHVNKIEIHGILWCLDQFVQKGQIDRVVASTLLKKLMKYNKRLPFKDCENYIKERWGRTLS